MEGSVPVTGNPEADELNATNPLALLLSMVLDQHMQKRRPGTQAPSVR